MCKTVMYIPSGNLDRYEEDYYDLIIKEPSNFRTLNEDSRKLECSNMICEMLDKFVASIQGKEENKRIALLFDEAQFLVSGDGFVFRRVRWWLRTERKAKVVAVFAGTTSKLANFYGGESVPTNFSRQNNISKYLNFPMKGLQKPLLVYKPFFHISTIGCFHKTCSETSSTDFEKAAFYGRPLFAYLQKNKDLLANEILENQNKRIVNNKLYTILSRMLLSNEAANWSKCKIARYSILGTRVQMGITTSLGFTSDLISNAYANLVDFYSIEDFDVETMSVARISFMPDPVCAALAMGLMNDKWSIGTNGVQQDYVGKTKKFWSTAAMELFASGICLPDKGDAGEVMAALYLLFCGDEIRFERDNYLRTFAIPLDEWYTALFCNSKENVNSEETAASNCMDDTGSRREISVNFIQVCRNYFRGHSWKTQQALELMYKSAVAYYVYQSCPAIDLVASIKVVSDNKSSYHPLLVSVKCWQRMTSSHISKAMTKMENLLTEIRETQKEGEEMKPALCLLVTIGTEFDKNIPTEYIEEKLDSFPDKDTYRLISITDKDQFGISTALTESCTAGIVAEIYSSHAFAYGEDNANPLNSLRKKPNEIVKDYVTSMFQKLNKTPTHSE